LQKQYGVDMPFYFHDGESDWPDDDNLLDAYLLGTRRIGHGLNLYQYPALEKRFMERNVALEVCPLSNQILGYVRDLRCHPASGYLRRGLPLVISSDDPAVFGYEGLSYDFWIVVMAWELDLASLKQLALNSITHSAMSVEEQRSARSRWQRQWDLFVDHLLEQKAGSP